MSNLGSQVKWRDNVKQYPSSAKLFIKSPKLHWLDNVKAIDYSFSLEKMSV